MKKLIDMNFVETQNLFREYKDIPENELNDLKYFANFMRTRKEDEKSKDCTAHLIDIWYDSLEKDDSNPDYSVYADDEYYKEVFGCYFVYARTYLKYFNKHNKVFVDETFAEYAKRITGYSGTILDLGNGIGFSSILLKEIFPDYDVYGTNFKGSDQWTINEKLSKTYDFKIIESHHEVDSADIVFASEYFEHIQRPYEHVKDIIEGTNPRIIITANSFNKIAVGHFKNYYYGEEQIHESKAQRKFVEVMNSHGYKKIKTGFWNNTPNVYVRHTTGLQSFLNENRVWDNPKG